MPRQIVESVHLEAKMQSEQETGAGSKKKPDSAAAPLKKDGGGSKEPVSVELEQFLSKWSRIIERIHLPLAKRCLMAGKPVALANGKLTLAFSHNFNKDKLFVPELLAVSEKAIFEEVGQSIKLVGKIDPGIIIEVIPGHSSMPPVIPEIQSPVPENPPAADVVKSALDVFGGEMVG